MKYFISLMIILSACTLRNGDNGINGKDGQDGSDGIDGIQGPPGAPGDNGATGPAGADGTLITLVKLCPGTPSYGTFIEFGMCIEGKLYGVYSANGGFLAYLPDGAYLSNGIGSACNLTVTGCTITH